jgi:hypothetical protein
MYYVLDINTGCYKILSWSVEFIQGCAFACCLTILRFIFIISLIRFFFNVSGARFLGKSNASW